MTRRVRAAVLLSFLFAASGLSVVPAQSVGLMVGRNGSLIQASGSVGSEEGFGLTLGAGYSIAGVMDFGLRFGADIIASEASVTSDIGMNYAYAPLRQSPGIPFSGQIYGSYTFRSESSEFLTDNRLLYESRGYTIGVAFVHDLSVSALLGFRLAGLAEYTNYLATTSVGFDPTGFTGSSDVDYAEYPQVERDAGFDYGGYVGVTLSLSGGGAVLLGSAVLVDPNLAWDVRPDLQIMLTR